jgi:hypothetical protein
MDDQQTREGEATSEQNGGSGEHESEEQAKAQKVEEEAEEAKEKVKELEENPPDDLEDWPDDKAKYETFGGPEGEHSYEEGPEKKLGPSSLRHHEDGKVTVAGDEVDNPDEFKGKPIPGGPTDPDSPRMYGEEDLSEKSSTSDGESDDDDGESGDEDDSDSDDSRASGDSEDADARQRADS